MLKTSSDFNKVNRILVIGSVTLFNAFTMSLLPLLTKAQVEFGPVLKDRKVAYEDGVLVITDDISLATEVDGLPLDVMAFLIEAVEDVSFLEYIEAAAGDFLRNPGENLLIKNLKIHLNLDLPWVCETLTRLLWIPLIAEFQTQTAVRNFVKENPPLPIEAGFVLLTSMPRPDLREAYLEQQNAIIWENRESVEDLIFVIHPATETSWAIEILAEENIHTPTLEPTYPRTMTIVELVTLIKEML